MNKLAARNYRKTEALTNEEIQREILSLVSSNQCDTYRNELDYVLDSFSNLISSSKFQGGYNDLYGVYQDEIKDTIRNIKESVRLYLHGYLYHSFIRFNKRWDKMWRELFSKDAVTYIIQPGEVLYKIRKVENESFKRSDFFHVPFNQRGKIGNNRFSISGYPCLYLGRSIYTCWEEMRRLSLSEIAAAGFHFQKPIRLLDLRITSDINSEEKEALTMFLLPYIIASSIRVHSDQALFKPEYIIPQLLLHSVIRNRKMNYYDGVIYTSTRRNNWFDDRGIEMFDNVAIPVMSNRSNNYCKVLASYISVTDPVYFEQEFLQGKIPLGVIGNRKYENTAFYALESNIKEKDFQPII